MTGSVAKDLETAVDALLARASEMTPDSIRKLIAAFRVMPMLGVTDEEAEFLAKRLEMRHDVTMRVGSVLVEPDFKPWLDQVVAGVDFYYWNRYRRLLAEEMQLSQQVITTLHSETDRALGLLQNPTIAGPWARRGMVVGHVQSGKTANYIGLISKAADVGYRVIIVIAGVHNNLRNQTQKRVDLGFVGRDSARLLSKKEERFVGVGRFDATRRPITFTNSLKDFNKEMATGLGLPLHTITEPAVFVIKKNYNTLKNLSDWMAEHNATAAARDLPMLLIDDEADNASINVQYGAGEVSRINGQIRRLLKHFARTCYVGYTATPFANIFIDPDSAAEMLGEDLFPRHFILSLDPPSNYFGSERVFGSGARSVLRHIEDNEDWLPLKHTKEHVLERLPDSLIAATRAFCVSRAIRLGRGQRGEHCSMLVNASRFTRVQGLIRTALQELIVDIQASARLNAALPAEKALKNPELAALHETWSSEYKAHCSWAEVQQNLIEAVAPIRVVEVNSQSHGTLNYDDYKGSGLNVIAVGGYSLSRGLTLEGLMISYFLRNSVMYDTLMQMGRWFGYRPGYEDLCRVWMPEEAEGWYAHVSESIEELREELRAMAAAGATPEEFGLKVRAHPDTLIVTARNKMGSGKRLIVRIGLGKAFVETASLRRDEDSLRANRAAVLAFARALKDLGVDLHSRTEVSGGALIRDVPVEPVLAFIASFANSPVSMLTEPGPVTKYIQARQGGELALWDLLVAGTQGFEPTIEDNTFDFPVNCQRRTVGKKSDTRTLRVTNKQRVASRGAEKTGLSARLISEAEEEFRLHTSANAGGGWNYPDRIYRVKRERPLLIIHMLNLLSNEQPLFNEPVVAWSIGFPDTALPEERVEYVVTTTWLRENLPDDSDDEGLESDDG